MNDRRSSSLSADKRRLFEKLLAAKGLAAPSAPAIVRSTAPGPYRCTSSQSRIWFIEQLEGSSSTYNMSGAITLSGMIDVDALHRAVLTIFARHDILRTRFVGRNGDVFQEVDPSARLAWRFTDLRQLDPARALARLHDLSSSESGDSFDLTLGGLFRCHLVCMADDEHVMIVTMHHIISDGWSLGVLIGELGKLYGAYAANEADPLPMLDVQYADVAEWQFAHADTAPLTKQLDHWRNHLADVPDLLDLPTDHPRPSVRTGRGGQFSIDLDPTLVAGLHDLAHREQLTLFMLLYAGLAALLHLLSGQRDIVIAVPVANRRSKQVESLIGLFVNVLLIRVHIDHDDSLSTLIGRVKHAAIEGFDNQDVPLDRVIEAINPARHLSRHALFQVMLAVQNTPTRALAMSGIQMSLQEFENGTAKCDLSLSVQEANGTVVCDVSYATDLFDQSTMVRWTDHWQALLSQMISDSSVRIADIALLSPAERARVVDEFNATDDEQSGGTLAHGLFERARHLHPDMIAVEHRAERLSYAALDDRADRLAVRLRLMGVRAGGRVAICVERGIAAAVAILGILKAGAACVPLDPAYPEDRIRFMLDDAAPQAIVGQAHLLAFMPATSCAAIIDAAGLVVGEKDDATLAPPSAVRPPMPDDVAYVVYTSGSTGQPKGVEYPHRALANLVEWHQRTLRPTTRMLQFASLSFDASFHELFAAWAAGGTVVVPDEDERRDVNRLARFLTEHRIAKVILPGAMLQNLAERHRVDPCPFPDLDEVMVTGDRLTITPALRDLFARMPRARLHNHYGPSETHVVTALTFDSDPASWPDHPSIGRPIANNRVYVVDEALRPVPIDMIGEICVAGVGLAQGYVGREDLTTERFVADPFDDRPGARLYRTGDLGRWRQSGLLECLGRNDRQIKFNGMRVEPAEIELCLARHPGVREAAVIAPFDGSGGRRLIAYVVPSGTAPNTAELRRHVEHHLPVHMRPAAFVSIAALPISPNGKLDHGALPVPDMASVVAAPFEAPVGKVEKSIAAIWSELLKVERVGRNDNFFALGGHSLLALQVVARLQATTGIELRLKDLFDRQTLAGIADLIDSLPPTVDPSGDPAVEVDPDREVLSI